MRFKKYINLFDIIINENITDPLNEVTVSGDVSTDFVVPKKNAHKYKQQNKRYYKTNIKPKDRSFKNLPRDSKKKPIVRFQDWLGLKQSSDFTKKSASGGKADNGKWYGYSHRAVYGFEPGMIVKKGHIAIKPGRKLPYKIKNDEDAKWHAIEFSRQVS